MLPLGLLSLPLLLLLLLPLLFGLLGLLLGPVAGRTLSLPVGTLKL
jgi:hypothetical protein